MVSKWFTNENDKTDRHFATHISINDNILPDIVVIRSKLLNLKLCVPLPSKFAGAKDRSGCGFLRAIFINFNLIDFVRRLWTSVKFSFWDEHSMVDWQSCHPYKMFRNVSISFSCFSQLSNSREIIWWIFYKVKITETHTKIAVLGVASRVKWNFGEQHTNWSNAASWIFSGFHHCK